MNTRHKLNFQSLFLSCSMQEIWLPTELHWVLSIRYDYEIFRKNIFSALSFLTFPFSTKKLFDQLSNVRHRFHFFFCFFNLLSRVVCPVNYSHIGAKKRNKVFCFFPLMRISAKRTSQNIFHFVLRKKVVKRTIHYPP